MEFAKIHNKGQAQLFKNQYLEYLTKTHPLVIWGMYTPVLLYFPFLAITRFLISPLTVAGFFLFGMLFWTFTEYIMHRFVFHHHPKTERTRKFVYIMHGNHHEYPRDKQRLFMPPVPSIILASAFFGLFFLALGTKAFAFFPGFMLGYLLYGSMHYAIHAWNPPFKWMKGLWRNHHLHHYKHGNLGFGVSSTIWDFVFGTLYDRKENMSKEAVKEQMY